MAAASLFTAISTCSRCRFTGWRTTRCARGNIGWSHLTDLGANFIGSYSFYLLGSPFFWLTIPFPRRVAAISHGPALHAEIRLGGTDGYVYLHRYARSPSTALLASLLYAFSGFSVYNIFFNHFHEAIIFFPLLLAALDEYMYAHRRGIFALAVAACCIVNYYFFVGMVCFTVIYFFVRLLSGSWKISPQNFLLLALEAVLGLGISCILLVPSVLCIMQNYRVSNPISGWNALLYDKNQRYVHILQSLFFPPDLPARPNFTPDSARRASLGAWLPMFSMTGVIGWLQTRRRHWLKKCSGSCSSWRLSGSQRGFPALERLVPRPLVLHADADDGSRHDDGAREPMRRLEALDQVDNGDHGRDGPCDRPDADAHQGGRRDRLRHLRSREIPDALLVLRGDRADLPDAHGVSAHLLRARLEKFFRASFVCLSAVITLYSIYFIALGKTQSDYTYNHIIPYALNGGEDVSIEDLRDDRVRVDFYESLDNSAMFWQVQSIQAFHSIVPGSLMEFYDSIGVQRDVASRPDTAHYGLRALTSVKYPSTATTTTVFRRRGLRLALDDRLDVLRQRERLRHLGKRELHPDGLPTTAT